MTTYHGGKQRIGLDIAKTIYKTTISLDCEIKGYCEPFCGMLGVYRHIPILFENFKPKLNYFAGDINKSVVLMWKKAQKGWVPPRKKITKSAFHKLKYDGKCSALKGFVGHVFTYRGVFFDGFFPHRETKIEHNSDNVKNIAKIIKKVKFRCCSFEKFSKLKRCVIYCDPPYKGTEKRYYNGREYRDRLTFNHIKFYQWCEKMSKNNIIFISEYTKPKIKGIKKIWSKGKEKLYFLPQEK